MLSTSDHVYAPTTRGGLLPPHKPSFSAADVLGKSCGCFTGMGKHSMEWTQAVFVYNRTLCSPLPTMSMRQQPGVVCCPLTNLLFLLQMCLEKAAAALQAWANIVWSGRRPSSSTIAPYALHFRPCLCANNQGWFVAPSQTFFFCCRCAWKKLRLLY